MSVPGLAGAVLISLLGTMSLHAGTATVAERWSAERANQWYDRQPWLVGANYIPSDAINELEMFQAATFNASLNDKELGMAESIGMNTARVFLQDQLWAQDSEGFKARLDTFLSIAAKHHIRPILVLFDSCWETDPKLGPSPRYSLHFPASFAIPAGVPDDHPQSELRFCLYRRPSCILLFHPSRRLKCGDAPHRSADQENCFTRPSRAQAVPQIYKPLASITGHSETKLAHPECSI